LLVQFVCAARQSHFAVEMGAEGMLHGEHGGKPVMAVLMGPSDSGKCTFAEAVTVGSAAARLGSGSMCGALRCRKVFLMVNKIYRALCISYCGYQRICESPIKTGLKSSRMTSPRDPNPPARGFASAMWAAGNSPLFRL
jgi:hypothetical protein